MAHDGDAAIDDVAHGVGDRDPTLELDGLGAALLEEPG